MSVTTNIFFSVLLGICFVGAIVCVIVIIEAIVDLTYCFKVKKEQGEALKGGKDFENH